ncbi:MAG: hypothetical protein R2880_16285 [Deinococcales bacterium]
MRLEAEFKESLWFKGTWADDKFAYPRTGMAPKSSPIKLKRVFDGPAVEPRHALALQLKPLLV